jgi:predicted MarR family transcription regulator
VIIPNKCKQTNNRSKSYEKATIVVSSLHIIPAMSPAIRPPIVFAMGLTIIAHYRWFF